MKMYLKLNISVPATQPAGLRRRLLLPTPRSTTGYGVGRNSGGEVIFGWCIKSVSTQRRGEFGQLLICGGIAVYKTYNGWVTGPTAHTSSLNWLDVRILLPGDKWTSGQQSVGRPCPLAGFRAKGLFIISSKIKDQSRMVYFKTQMFL